MEKISADEYILCVGYSIMTNDYLTSVLNVHIYIILTMNCFAHVSSFCLAPCPHLHVILFYQLIVSCIIQVFAYGQ